jgi:hypothetical protein
VMRHGNHGEDRFLTRGEDTHGILGQKLDA